MKKKGISLVALVVTIIVLIILTGAVVATFMEGGIIDRAKESVFKNDMRSYQEILMVKSAVNEIELQIGDGTIGRLNAIELEKIQEIIPEFKVEYKELIAIDEGKMVLGARVTQEEDKMTKDEKQYKKWLLELGIGLVTLPENAIANIAKVGDYVEYNQYGDIPADLPISLSRQSINWKVLKNDGRQVTLISETPIDSITLEGAEGWLYGPSNIDKTYNGLYGGNMGIARNLKREDVNEIMGYKAEKVLYFNNVGFEVEVDYGTTIGIIEKEQNITVGDRYTPDGKDISNYKIDYYYYTGNTYKAGKEKEYELIFGQDTEYWLSSNGLYLALQNNIYVDYFVYEINSGDMDAWDVLYDSTGEYSEALVRAGRPIVILDSDVKIANKTAGGQTIDTAWQLTK